VLPPAATPPEAAAAPPLEEYVVGAPVFLLTVVDPADEPVPDPGAGLLTVTGWAVAAYPPLDVPVVTWVPVEEVLFLD